MNIDRSPCQQYVGIFPSPGTTPQQYMFAAAKGNQWIREFATHLIRASTLDRGVRKPAAAIAECADSDKAT